MRTLLFIVITFFLFSCKNNSSEILIDRHFKDSIALADGNKALGNFYFGMDKKETQDLINKFIINDDGLTIHKDFIHFIFADYTPYGELYRLEFISDVQKEDNPKEVPFREFLVKKFGLETYKNSNRWKVGDRTIYVTFKNSCETIGSRRSFQKKNRYIPDTGFRLMNFYTLIIENDSLKRLINEQNNIIYNKQKEIINQEQKNQDSLNNIRLNEQLKNL